MSNGEVCCILGVCCPPTEQRAAIVKALVRDTAMNEETAEDAAEWIMRTVDLAPKGSLDALKVSFAQTKHQGDQGA